jgi:adenosine deaminase
MKLKEIDVGELFGDSLAHKVALDVSQVSSGGTFRFVSIAEKSTEGINNLITNLNGLLLVKQLSKNHYEINIKTYDKEGNEIYRNIGEWKNGSLIKRNSLTAFEIKNLSQGVILERIFKNRRIPFSNTDSLPTPITDLHTHYTGVLTAQSVYDIALKTAPKTVLFSQKYLIKHGLITKEVYERLKRYNDNDPSIKRKDLFTLEQLNKIPGFREKLISKMEIPAEQQITFTNLNDVYAAREPFFKSKSLNIFEMYIEQIAKDYKAAGVKYCEIDVAPALFLPFKGKQRVSKMKYIENILEKMKNKYGVDINFMLANSRTQNTKEQIDNFLLTSYELAKYPFICGTDILGHEKTSNRDFEYVYASMTRFCVMNGLKSFTIRSHSGESKEHLDNTKVFLKSIDRELEQLRKEGYNTEGIPDIRIGHGLQGMDDETIELCRKLGATIEINASSNFSLNNLDFIRQVPIKKYLDAGLKVVLGTDGNGIYLTNSRDEAKIARAAGVTVEQLRAMRNNETIYVERKVAEKKVRRKMKDRIIDVYGASTVAHKSNSQRISDRVVINSSSINERLKKSSKKPIFITGTEQENELNANQKNIFVNQINEIVKRVSYNGDFICLYGNRDNYINSIVLEAARKNNVNVMVLNSPDNIDCKEQLIYGADKYEVAYNVANIMSDVGGEIVAIGGGVFTSELITMAHNKGCKIHLESRIDGASKDKAELYAKESRSESTDPISQETVSDKTRNENSVGVKRL